MNSISFSPINFLPNYQRKTTNSVSFGQIEDSFKRTTPKSEFEKFSEWMRKTGFDESELISILNNKENEIGHGSSHIAYRIPGNDDYVLRTYKPTKIDSINDIKFLDKEDRNLKINIGQRIGLFTFKNDKGLTEGVEVLKKANGNSYGVPDQTAIYDEFGNIKEGEEPYESSIRAKDYKTLLDIASSYDVKVFEDAIERLQEAAKANYSFDALNPNNILLAEDEINLIDFDNFNLDFEPFEFLYSLINMNYFMTYQSEYLNLATPEEKKEAFFETIDIINKYIQALQNKGIKYDYSSRHMKANEVFTSLPFKCYLLSQGYQTEDAQKLLIDKGIVQE